MISENKADTPVERIHTDAVRTIKVLLMGNGQYIVAVMVECIDYTLVSFANEKSETANSVFKIVREIETSLIRKARKLICIRNKSGEVGTHRQGEGVFWK